jgi:quercetin dioxygenase-like cupin family protein
MVRKVRVRYLIDEQHGSSRFALRLYAVDKGGHTPLDEHAYEHQVYILGGRGMLRELKETGPTKPLQRGMRFLFRHKRFTNSAMIGTNRSFSYA